MLHPFTIDGAGEMLIAIMGSGGVGGYVGAWLQAAGEEVVFIARGAHLDAMRRDGLRIEHPTLPLHLPRVAATDDPATVGPVDLVIFAVKLGDTEAAARSLGPMVGAGTRVLTLQNGIDSVAMIAPHVDAPVLGGVIYVSAVIDRPGVIRSPGGLHVIVADAADGDPVMAALAAAASRVDGLDVRLDDAVDTIVWEKFVALASLSGTTSLLRATMGQILGHPETRLLQRQLVLEAVAVAQAAGHPLREGLADEVMTRLAAMPGTFRSSMSEDLECGKPLELRWLSGRVHGLGLELGVPTPAHTMVYRGLVLHEDGRA
jgi:2-dehydropantoate 2-reductase